MGMALHFQIVAVLLPLVTCEMIHSGTPSDVPALADCAIRQAAWKYGQKLQPQRGEFKTLYDALQLHACDGVLAPASLDAWLPSSEPLPKDQRVLFVDSSMLEGGGAPTSGDTYGTIADAVNASKSLPKPLTIALREGTHFISSGPVQLGAEESGLTIRNAPGERASVSGGRNLETRWSASTACNGCYEASLKGQVKDVPGLRLNGVREIRARFPNFDPELDAMIDGRYRVHDGLSGWVTGETIWIEKGAENMNGVPGTWPPEEKAVTHVIESKDWPDVEWPMNIMTNGTVDPDRWTGEGAWGTYWVGVGGTCVDRSPPAGYWCAPGAPRRISAPNHPSGINPNRSQLPNSPYARPDGAVVHAWRPGHWYTNIFEVASNSTGSLMFSRGGIQGGEGVTGGEAWYVENVLEELDMGREWYYDNRSQILYYKPNNTDGSAPTGSFVVTAETVLFNVTGTQSKPAHNITISGLTIRDTAHTFFEPHGLPSGGDWGLEKQGAITLVGTDTISISSNLFTRLDGNAVFIGGFNRGMTIEGNEFFGIGNSAMAAWGDTSFNLTGNGSIALPYPIGPDGRSGEQPRGTRVLNNIVREIGIWEKQSSLWFQAVTAQTLIKGNVFFNGPRAALNFNDGFGGGDEIMENLLLNTCRESSDHGPWNSWDRVPYITDIRTGKPSIIPADRHIHHNFIIANYNSQEAIDTDDGSAYFKTYSNFFAYGDNGLKSDFGGHDHEWQKNILAYVGKCFDDFVNNDKGYNNAFFNNTCVARTASGYNSDCDKDKSWRIDTNRIYTSTGDLIVCGRSWADWLDRYKYFTRDIDTTVSKWPSDGQLIAWAQKLLGFGEMKAQQAIVV
jgi:hypothetical protein